MSSRAGKNANFPGMKKEKYYISREIFIWLRSSHLAAAAAQGGVWGGMCPPEKLENFEKWRCKWRHLVHYLKVNFSIIRLIEAYKIGGLEAIYHQHRCIYVCYVWNVTFNVYQNNHNGAYPLFYDRGSLSQSLPRAIHTRIRWNNYHVLDTHAKWSRARGSEKSTWSRHTMSDWL